MAFKTVVVTLHHIKNDNTGDDPGTALEVFGRFDVLRFAFNPDIGEIVTIESFNLFDKSGNDAVAIDQGSKFPLNSRCEFQILSGEFLQITGHLGEQDVIGENDPLGSIDFRIPFDDIETEALLFPFQGGDQRVSVKMSTLLTAQGSGI